ncbi:Pro-Pol polyprotein [Dictyocoela muelleri]|nr:Pro-Pol polyprotein [Dictyocoela muelleri]
MFKSTIKTCEYCQKCKKRHLMYGKPAGNVISETILKNISSDVYGPFDAIDYKHRFNTDKLFIITYTDRCSKFTKCYFTNKITSKDLLKSFKKEYLTEFNCPKTFLSDNGKCYTSKNTLKYFNESHIRQIFTSPFNPTGNSLSERINSTISNILRIYKKWVIKLIEIAIENRIKNIKNTNIGQSPNEIISKKIKNRPRKI